jgi:type IV pilus assembly protein PilW
MNTPARCNLVPNAARQRGLTLIELLVSMAIAVFLLGGLLTIVGNTRRAFAAQNVMAQLQDNQRLAMTLIGDVIQEAGFFPDPTTNTSGAILPVIAGTFPTAGQAITGTYLAGTPDTITVRFATTKTEGAINCTGGTSTTANPPVVYINRFSVDTVNNNLVCTLTTNGVAAPAVPLVSGVQSLSILYGVTTNTALGNGAVDTYLRADQMTAANWTNVVTVKVTVTFLNPLAGQPNQPATIPFQRVVGVMNRTGVKV